MKRAVFISFLGILFSASMLFAQSNGGIVGGEVSPAPDNAPPARPAGSPVEITAEKMVYDENKRIVFFAGNVVAEHQGLTLWADQVTAYFSGGGDQRFQVEKVDRVVATGNVRAEQGKTKGSCGKVTYHVEDRVLVMEENPVLENGPNSITGDKIRFFAKENRSEVVSGGGKRVRAIFLSPADLKVQ